MACSSRAVQTDGPGPPTPGRPGDSCRYLVVTGALRLGSPGRGLRRLTSRLLEPGGLHPACPPWRRLPIGTVAYVLQKSMVEVGQPPDSAYQPLQKESIP